MNLSISDISTWLSKHSDVGSNRFSLKNFDRNQISFLEDYFEKNPYPDTVQMTELVEKLNVEYKKVQSWFYNKRSKTSTKMDPFERSNRYSNNSQSSEEQFAYLQDQFEVDADCDMERAKEIA